MPNRSTHIFEELLAAAQGTAALIVGDRKAPSFFDFSRRGLAGSFIALLIATTFSAYLPVLTGTTDDGLSPGQELLTVAVLVAMQIAFSALVLRQLGRLDGLVPYLVADNWATFFVTAISLLLNLVGLPGKTALVILAILAFVIEINIARLVVTLRPWQIVMLLVAQGVGVSIVAILISAAFPIPDATLALSP